MENKIKRGTLNKKVENKIKEEVTKFLKFGRGDWDLRHTVTSVKWMRELIKKCGGNEKILITAMYFHDTGYEDLSSNLTHKNVMKAKKIHAETGALNVKKILPQLNYFSKEEIERIAYLVLMHDKHENIIEKDRQLVFDADSLAQIDWENCPPAFDKENCEEFLSSYFKRRKKFLNTEFAIEKTKNLLKNAKEYLKNL